MEFLKKPREPWEIGIDPILSSPDMAPLFYYEDFKKTNRYLRIIQSSQALRWYLNSTAALTLDDESIRTVSTATSLRNEFAGPMGMKPKKMRRLLSHIYDTRWIRSSGQMETKELQCGLDYLIAISTKHNKAYQELPTVEVPVKPELSLLVGYDATNWEGIGAIYFAFQDTSVSCEPTPAFAIRGNPIKNPETGDNEFAFRGVQSWVSDRHSSLVGLQQLLQENISCAPRQAVEEIFAILRRRAYLLNKFENMVLGEKSNGARYRFFLACALTYLRSSGFLIFRGIAHEQHPEVLIPKRNGTSMSLNYNEFWKELGFDKQCKDDKHPWVTSPSLIDDITAGSLPTKLRPAGRAILDSIRNISVATPFPLD